jgi:acyl-CoA reductase-like NAD-dependent aldehyde dehydrogenase
MKLADPTLLKSQCLVDGKWVGKGVDPIDNPATGELIAKVPRFGHVEAVGAIEAAARAFTPWAKALPKERAQILRRWFDLIIANRDDIALIMTSEQGKPLAEARGEVDYAASYIEFFGEEAARSANSPSASAVSGVSGAGLATTVQPTAKAGATLRVIMAAGKFHGVIAATTPIGCLITTMRESARKVGLTSP